MGEVIAGHSEAECLEIPPSYRVVVLLQHVPETSGTVSATTERKAVTLPFDQVKQRRRSPRRGVAGASTRRVASIDRA